MRASARSEHAQAPYRKTQLGDTAEAHDDIGPRDLPFDRPGRKAAERDAAKHNGLTRGDVRDDTRG